MSAIDIRKTHTLGKDKAREAAESLSGMLKDKFQVQTQWDGDVLKFERSGAKGSIAISDTDVHVKVELGLMLKAFKGQVEGQVTKYLEKYLK
ncbi:MAG: polyhydroxyalkanoic acid system family protein [Myxococcales bacterium]|nr:MAG: polyhydroxyalkanoic acid system family protein [Myxococcales bacterium]